MEHEDDCIDDWYELGRKLYAGEPRFVLVFDEAEPPERVSVFFKSNGGSNGKPTFFKYATHEALTILREKGILEIREFGRGSSKMSGWILTKEGRNRIGRYDRSGNRIPTNPGRAFTLDGPLGKRLPIAGFLQKNK